MHSKPQIVVVGISNLESCTSFPETLMNLIPFEFEDILLFCGLQRRKIFPLESPPMVSISLHVSCRIVT